MIEIIGKRCCCNLDRFTKKDPYGFYTHSFLRENIEFGTITLIKTSPDFKHANYLLRVKFDKGEEVEMSSEWITILPFLMTEKTI